MSYKRKLLVLSSLTAVLAGVYVLTFVFDPELSGRRSDAYTWLNPRLRDSVDRIDFNGGEASGRDGSSLALSLVRRNGRWLVLRDALEYPAREARVEELLDLLSRRSSYPRRSDSPSSHGIFGLSEAVASRITLRGGAGLPLLDLLIGGADAGGGSLYLRKANSGEVRSGDGGLSAYIDNEARSWYDLRLFPETGDTVLAAESLQRLTVRAPDREDGASPPAMLISRERNSWRIEAGDRSLDPEAVEKSRVDSYIRGILSPTGADFVAAAREGAAASLILELGDGRVLTLNLGPPGEEGRRRAWIGAGENPYGYLLASWAVDRLFREPEYFQKP
jgi:hypothetical protein